MVDFTKKTTRANFTIQGKQFTCAAPFGEGHPCTANEASVLNQILRENVRNNNATAVQKALDAGTEEVEIQTSLDDYVRTYAFGQRRGGGGRSLSPVERESMNIARELVRAAIKAKGIKLADVTSAKITSLAQDAIQKNPSITEQAEQRVKLLEASAESELEIDLSDATAPAEETTDEAADSDAEEAA